MSQQRDGTSEESMQLMQEFWSWEDFKFNERKVAPTAKIPVAKGKHGSSLSQA